MEFCTDLQDCITVLVKKYSLKTMQYMHKFIDVQTIDWAYPKYNEVKNLPSFGFKLHVPATIFNAPLVFIKLIPYLLAEEIIFKVIASNTLLKKLNENMFGYTESGRFITIFPENNIHASEIAMKIIDILKSLQTIPIPLDKNFCNQNLVYYHYDQIQKNEYCSGVIQKASISEDEEKSMSVSKIFLETDNIKPTKTYSKKLLLGKYIVLETIRQRARGGVYFGLEKTSKFGSCRPVILKEARDFGEIEFSGVDSVERLHWQFQMLKKLHKFEITPIPYNIQKENNITILSIEQLNGKSLREELLTDKQYSLDEALIIFEKILIQVIKLHELDIFFLELCPDNIILCENGIIKLIDCDCCYTNGCPAWDAWNCGTPGFFPDSTLLESTNHPKKDWFYLRDLYSLGRILIACLFPSWYKSFFVSCSIDKLNYAVNDLINSLPVSLQSMLKKCLLISSSFENIIELEKNFRLIKLSE